MDAHTEVYGQDIDEKHFGQVLQRIGERIENGDVSLFETTEEMEVVADDIVARSITFETTVLSDEFERAIQMKSE